MHRKQKKALSCKPPPLQPRPRFWLQRLCKLSCKGSWSMSSKRSLPGKSTCHKHHCVATTLLCLPLYLISLKPPNFPPSTYIFLSISSSLLGNWCHVTLPDTSVSVQSAVICHTLLQLSQPKLWLVPVVCETFSKKRNNISDKEMVQFDFKCLFTKH